MALLKKVRNKYLPNDVFVAIDAHNIEELKHLLKSSENRRRIYKGNISNDTAFHYALLQNNTEALKILLRSANSSQCFTIKNNADCVILQIAAIHSMGEAAEQICQHPLMTDSIINAMHPQSGNTPLHWAAINGDVSLSKILLKYGSAASIRKGNKDKKTPVFKAVEHNHPPVLHTLLDRDPGAVDIGDYNGTTPFCQAIKQNLHQCVEVLLSHRAKVDKQLLSLSIKLQRKEITATLIENYGEPVPELLMKDAEKLLGFKFMLERWKSRFRSWRTSQLLCCDSSKLVRQTGDDKADNEADTLSVSTVSVGESMLL